MEIIFHEGESHLPRVILDKENNKFEISGHSLPEDVNAFYTPILNWLDEYIQSPNENTEVTIKMVYFNTASSKMLYDVMDKLYTLYEKGNKVKVLWYYADDDEEMEEAGKEFEDMVDIPFEFISYPAD